jgi:hypothetical protein
MKSNNESFQMSRKFGYATSLSFLSTIALIMNKATMTMNEWIEWKLISIFLHHI